MTYTAFETPRTSVMYAAARMKRLVNVESSGNAGIFMSLTAIAIFSADSVVGAFARIRCAWG